MVPFAHYAKVVNNVCLAYFGLSPEYAVQLDYLVPFVEKAYPDLNVSLCVSDQFLPLTVRAFPSSQLQERSGNFAYLKEFRIDPADDHSILKFIRETWLTFTPVSVHDRNGVCLICPDAAHPARCLSEQQVKHLSELAVKKGYYPVVVGSDLHQRFPHVDVRYQISDKRAVVNDAGWVIGGENEYVFLAAASGVKSTLIPTGPGTDLYKVMFPHGEVLERI